MKDNVTRSALLVIDMENGFISAKSALCIKYAAATVGALSKTIANAREKGIPVFFVKRIYRADGSDVELTRYTGWKDAGRAMSPASMGISSAEAPEGLRPQPGDYTIIKPRWSAFFQTELDLILRRLGVHTVILTGTTTPNCIRTTAYDAVALDYNTVVIEDCCSSQSEEIQRANLEDMARIGVGILSSEEFACYDNGSVPDLAAEVRREVQSQTLPPEPFQADASGSVGWTDRW
jgi:nicotinamidase-related amidase